MFLTVFNITKYSIFQLKKKKKKKNLEIPPNILSPKKQVHIEPFILALAGKKSAFLQTLPEGINHNSWR